MMLVYQGSVANLCSMNEPLEFLSLRLDKRTFCTYSGNDRTVNMLMEYLDCNILEVVFIISID